LKQYILAKLSPKKPIVVLESNLTIALVTIDLHMAIIHVHIRKNLVKDVFFDGGFGVNVITDDLWKNLGLPTPKHALYTLQMVNQTFTKLVGLYKYL
jgi:hypothetical protein